VDVVGLAVEFEQASSPSYAARFGNLSKQSQHRRIDTPSLIFGAHHQVIVK